MHSPQRHAPQKSALSALCLCLSVGVLGWSGQALSQPEHTPVRSYALIIGHNAGTGREQPLRYAQQDAQRMAEALRRFGQIPSANIVALYGVDASGVRAGFEALNAKIVRETEANPGGESTLFVYYSGHADERALHLGQSALEFKALKALLDQSSADVKVVILDACHSGEMTRVKGAQPSQPFSFESIDRTSSQGLAIITSSSASEKSQESDSLKGSYFTHHLLTGMLGAADKSRDGRVSLGEAYQYAYTETLRSTSRTMHLQHPTYAFQIRGRRDVILTRFQAESGATGLLILEAPGHYVFFDQRAGGRLAAELRADAGAQLAMSRGAYTVRRRQGEAIFEGEIVMLPGQQLRLSAARLQPVRALATADKGSITTTDGLANLEVISPWAITLDAGLSRGLIEGMTGLGFVELGGRWDRRMFSLGVGARFGWGALSYASLSGDLFVGGLTLEPGVAWSKGRWRLGAQLPLGFDLLDQRLQAQATPTQLTRRLSSSPRLGAELAVDYLWGAHIGLNAQLGADWMRLRVDDAGGAVTKRWTTIPKLSLGLVFPLF